MRLAMLALIVLTPVAYAEVKEETYGKLADGREVKIYTLTNRNGMKAKIISYGAILTELHVPDKDGKLADVVLGFDKLEDYVKPHPYFGANVGRVANRIGGGEFMLDGKKYKLAKNNNDKHHLHGGKEGFDKKLWTAEIVEGDSDSVKFEYISKDGEEGYPGELEVSLTYTLTPDNRLKLRYEATTDAPTIVNLAHHSYFNLSGHDKGDILKHKLQVNAKSYTPTNDDLIPTGKIEPVAGTPYDFTEPKEIGARIKELKREPGGYDVNFDVGVHEGEPAHIATVSDPTSGRIMEVYSTEPGLQFYTGNYLDGKNIGKGGAVYKKHAGFCLEPQYFPDAINKLGTDGWYSPIIRPGEQYYQDTIFKFTVQK